MTAARFIPVCRTFDQGSLEVARIVETQQAEDDTDDQAEDDRLTKGRPVFPDGFGVGVQVTQAGDAVDDPVGHDREGHAGAVVR